MSTKLIIILLLVIAVVVITIIVVKKTKAKRAQKVAQHSFENSQVTGSTGGVAYTFNGATVASQVHEALHGYPWEYEQDAIVAINNTPKQFMPLVIKAYMDMFKLDLKTDLIKYFDKGNFEKVRHQFM